MSGSSSSSSSSDEDDRRQRKQKDYNSRSATYSNQELYEGRRRNDKPEAPPANSNNKIIQQQQPSSVSPPVPKQQQQAMPSEQAPPPKSPKVAFDDEAAIINKQDFAAAAGYQPPAPVIIKEPAHHATGKEQQQRQHRGHRYHGERTNILRTVLTAFCLFAGTIGYCFIGGLMFGYLEQSNEMAECVQLRYLYQKARNATAFTLYDVASSPDMGDESKLEAFLPILDTMRLSVQNISWDGRNCENMQMKWSLVSASFFSFTVVSTIGYGHITPRTNWGRLVAIAYATVGLPLMVLTLAKIGAVFAYYFRAFYFKLLCCGVCIQKRRNQARRRTSLMKRQSFRWKIDGNTDGNKASMDLLEDISSDEEEQNQNVGANIPLMLSLSVAASSVVVGILIYISLEKWSVSDAAYFSFISLATIGFGDLVPGYTPLTGATDEMKLCITAAYIFLGMAVLSMTLQMMQDEVIEKFRWLSGKARQICCRKKVGNEEDGKGKIKTDGALNMNIKKVAPSYHPADNQQNNSQRLTANWSAQLSPAQPKPTSPRH